MQSQTFYGSLAKFKYYFFNSPDLINLTWIMFSHFDFLISMSFLCTLHGLEISSLTSFYRGNVILKMDVILFTLSLRRSHLSIINRFEKQLRGFCMGGKKL